MGQCEFTPENKHIFKRLFNLNDCQDKKGIFDQFVQAFKKLKAELTEIDRFNKAHSRYEEVRTLTAHLAEALNKCMTSDQNELFKYVELLMKNARKIEETIPELENVSFFLCFLKFSSQILKGESHKILKRFQWDLIGILFSGYEII